MATTTFTPNWLGAGTSNGTSVLSPYHDTSTLDPYQYLQPSLAELQNAYQQAIQSPYIYTTVASTGAFLTPLAGWATTQQATTSPFVLPDGYIQCPSAPEIAMSPVFTLDEMEEAERMIEELRDRV